MKMHINCEDAVMWVAGEFRGKDDWRYRPRHEKPRRHDGKLGWGFTRQSFSDDRVFSSRPVQR